MPRKKKVSPKILGVQDDLETSDEQTEVPKRTLRTRIRNKIKSPLSPADKNVVQNKRKSVCTKDQQQSENGYDADSELDQKLDSSTDSDSDEKSCKMTISTDDDDEDDENDKRMQMSKSKHKYKLSTYGGEEIVYAPSTEQIDKENFTPPDSHSTPSLNQRVVRNLDDSLFGFNKLESPLNFSPVSSISSRGKPSPSRSPKTISFATSNVRRKRKSERAFDFPQEEEKKVKKKKSKREAPANDDYLEELREQFKEVEMHELVVEYC